MWTEQQRLQLPGLFAIFVAWSRVSPTACLRRRMSARQAQTLVRLCANVVRAEARPSRLRLFLPQLVSMLAEDAWAEPITAVLAAKASMFAKLAIKASGSVATTFGDVGEPLCSRSQLCVL